MSSNRLTNTIRERYIYDVVSEMPNSAKQFGDDLVDGYWELILSHAATEFDRVKLTEIYDQIKIPTRATKGSAGYDFFAPFDMSLTPGVEMKVPTGIRVEIDHGWWLACMRTGRTCQTASSTRAKPTTGCCNPTGA